MMTPEQIRTKLHADHAAGRECPSCDRQAGIVADNGGFYCTGCGHEWTAEDIEQE